MAMLDADKAFSGSIPENYDRYLVPLIFEPYAADLARRAAEWSPRSILEIAAGTGAVTRALAGRLPPSSCYVATDLNPAMLDQARSKQPSEFPVEWRQADAMALPFDDHIFDLVFCQFGAMFFPDRTGAYREAGRVLVAGGRFLFNVWDRLEENVFAQDVRNAIAAVLRDDPPQFFERTPHGYHDTEIIRRDLEQAGFSDVQIETLTQQSQATSARQVALAFCQGTPMRGEIEARLPGGLEEVTGEVETALIGKYGPGPIAARIQAHVITAVA